MAQCRVSRVECRGGFTLVELLVTTSLMALVGGAAVAALAGGLRVWERHAVCGRGQQAALIAFERLRRDVQSLRTFQPVSFNGVYNQCSFAAVERATPGGEGLLEIGRLGYFLDERRHVLCRSFVPYRLMKRYRVTERCDALLEGVTRMRLSYYGEEADSAAGWHDRWESGEPPLAVKAEVLVQEEGREAASHVSIMSLARSPSHDATEP